MFRIQKKIAQILFLFGLLSTIVNFLLRLVFRDMSFLETIIQPNIYISLIVTMLIFVTRNADYKIVRILHISVLIVVSTIAVIDEYDSFYGLGFAILALMLAYKYGFLNSGLRWKMIVLTLVLIGLIEYSTYRNSPEEIAVAADALIFLVLFMAFVYVIFKNEIDHLSSRNSDLETNLENLKNQRNILEQNLARKNLKIEQFIEKERLPVLEEGHRRQFFQKEFRLTHREMMTLMLAYDSGESNQFIADQLGIKASTVKQHLNRAFGKIDARNKSDMHAMIRDYVPDMEVSSNHHKTRTDSKLK